MYSMIECGSGLKIIYHQLDFTTDFSLVQFPPQACSGVSPSLQSLYAAGSSAVWKTVSLYLQIRIYL